MLNKLKRAIFFTVGSKVTPEEMEEAKAIELAHFLDVRLRNGAAFTFTMAPEPCEVLAGTITETIKKTYPALPIVTLDGAEPVIVANSNPDDPSPQKTLDGMTVDELVAYVSAHNYDITGFSGMNKADKLAAIRAHEEASSSWS